MKNGVTLVDYLLAIPVAIYFWCAERFDRSNRCEDSPDGTCFVICKDFKKQCQWCGKIEGVKDGR